MRKFMLVLTIFGTLGTWMILLSALKDVMGPPTGAKIDVLAVVFVALQAIAFPVAAVKLYRDLKENPPGAPPLVEPGEEDYETVMTYVRAQKRRLRLLVAAPFLLIGGCCGWVFFDSARSMVEANQFKGCIMNRRQMDAAIQEFTKEKNRAPQSLKELVDAKLNGKMPKCPVDGAYSLVKSKAGTMISNCSEHGSEDNPAQQKHPYM